MYKFENWTWCLCWLPLLGAIAGLPLLGIGVGGCTRWRIGRGGVAGCHGCHCWAPLLDAIAGDRGGVGAHVGGLGVVALLAAMGAIAGRHCWMPLLGIGEGWVYKLADWMW